MVFAMLFMKSQIIYSCPSCFRFGLRLFHSVSRLIPHLQIINLRCYTVVAGEPDVVSGVTRQAKEQSEEVNDMNRASLTSSSSVSREAPEAGLRPNLT